MADLALHLFGSPQLESDGKTIHIPRRKAYALAAYLALAPANSSRETLATLLWQDSSHEQAHAALRSTLSAMTTAVGQPWIEADRVTVTLNHALVKVDVITFLEAVNQTTGNADEDAPVSDVCLRSKLQAEALYRADFLNGFFISDNPEFEQWQSQQREWLRREYMEVQRWLSEHYLHRQQFEIALKHAQKWLLCDDLQESAHRQLMRIYAASGQRAEALRQYRQCEKLLDEALATPPEPATNQLYEAISSGTLESGLYTRSANQIARSVLPPLPTLLVGREEALGEIKTRLGVYGQSSNTITLVHGWPGVGKSTTVARLAHDADIMQHFTDGVLWVSLGESPDLAAELSRWAETLGIGGDKSQVRTIEDISTLLIAALRDKQMLLIIDDVWQVEHFKAIRVAGTQCRMLVTTRLLEVAIALASSADDIYRLPVLTEASGLELLKKLTPQTVDCYEEEARQLVNNLEGLPLAIHVAGKLLAAENQMGWGITELLSDLRQGANLLHADAPSDMLVAGRDTSPTVAALLARSTDVLDTETRQYFALLGLFVPKPATFHLEAMSAVWNVQDPRPIARRLVSHGLLEPLSAGRFQLHALLVLHAKTLLNRDFEDS